MEVTVDKVTLVGNESFVEFSTDFGSAIAVWNAISPTEGAIHDVELDVLERIVWGVNARCALKNVCSIKVENGSIKLTGILISIDADGTAAIDLAGSVILLEVVGFTGDVPVFLDLEIKKISLFPTGV